MTLLREALILPTILAIWK